MNIVITGEVQSGKTTWCLGLLNGLEANNIAAGGILCLDTRCGNVKIGTEVVDIQSGNRMVFSALSSLADFDGYDIGNYKISREGLWFAADAIKSGIANRCRVVFIDEIGRLELVGQGLISAAVQAYLEAPATVSVVRKTLLGKFTHTIRSRLPAVSFVTISTGSAGNTGKAETAFTDTPWFKEEAWLPSFRL